MFLITGSGWIWALLNVESNLPMLIGPWMLTPFFTNVIADEGCVHSEPWKICALSWKVTAFAFEASEASVSIWLLPLVPCQLVKLQVEMAHTWRLLPENVNVPEASMIAVPV